MPASSCSRSSAYMRDRPSEAASKPGRFRREIEPAGIGAAHDRRQPLRAAALARPNSSTITSKVQSSPRWLQNTSSMSNGVAPKRSATAATSDGATNRKTAFGSTKRRISQGQAMRSIFGRARVTQTVRPCASRGGSFAVRHQRQLGGAPGLEAALERFGRDALRGAARRRRPG